MGKESPELGRKRNINEIPQHDYMETKCSECSV